MVKYSFKACAWPPLLGPVLYIIMAALQVPQAAAIGESHTLEPMKHVPASVAAFLVA
jgi:hypothetical protein